MADTNFTHIDDVVSYLNSCHEAFCYVTSILRSIKEKPGLEGEIKKLTGAAYIIAENFEQLSYEWTDEVKTSGVGTFNSKGKIEVLNKDN